MKRLQTMLLVAIALGLLTVAQANRSVAQDNAAGQKPCQLNRAVTVSMNYLLALPKDYDQKPSWPLLLFLHGAGERGDNLDLLKKHGLPKLIEAGQQFPFIVVSPQCPKDHWWEPFELKVLLDDLVQKYKVDQDRIYLTGLSMGGFGTWALAAYYPDRFAAIAPVCGGGDPVWVKRIAHIPVWVFHGAKDPVVPLARSEQMVDALKKKNATVKLTVYPEATHDSWTETYADPQLYQWLLQQKRPAKKVEKAEEVKK